jgi:hypothetical protein
MAETHDIGPRRFVTTVTYPRVAERPPLWEFGAETRETEDPYRIGYGWVFRVPFTRWAVLFGQWADDGGPESERLLEALRGTELDADTETIKEW